MNVSKTARLTKQMNRLTTMC